MNDASRLFFTSFLMLFIELALIRWLGSNVLFLSYFSNFVLMGSFLGIGLGFLRSKSSKLYLWSPILLMLLILFVSIFPVHISYNGSSGLNSLLIFGKYKKTGLPIWLTLPILFLLVTIVMAAIAHNVAILFSRFKPLVAYRLDILGALAGIGVFSGMSYLNSAPIFWGIIVFSIYALLFFHEWKKPSSIHYLQIAALFIIFATLGNESASPGQFWSPYYKISLYSYEDKIFGNYLEAWVNGIPHQRIESIKRREATEPAYFLPYQHRADQLPPQKILIIGAGTGGDAAIALAKGAKQVDAVEIDPVLYGLGKRFNPDHPYSNPNVHVVINDGRAFLQQSHDRYDMILFALPDSHTLVSGQSSLRLESYLFTKEAIQAARNHLTSNGILALYNYYLQPWYIDRLANTLQTVFDQSPCLDTFGQKNDWFAVLTVSANPSALKCSTHWTPLSITPVVAPATDDHPFVYLQHNRIPMLYCITLAFILLTTFFVMRVTSGTFRAIHSHLDLFFMGMAFLLLETKSIAAFSLLFGTTWMVNALVFAGILFMVYLAIEVTHRFPKLTPLYLYGLLLLSLAIGWMVPEHNLLILPITQRFFVSVLLLFSPVFFANLIFTNRFQDTADSAAAFGVNTIGAMIGGVVEYCALITGYQFLLIVIAVFYTLAFLVSQSVLAKTTVGPSQNHIMPN